MYNHQEYIEKNRQLTPKELIGKRFQLIRNGNHGQMMCRGYQYTLLDYDITKECPYKFTSDWGYDRPYSITEQTFKNDMRIIK